MQFIASGNNQWWCFSMGKVNILIEEAFVSLFNSSTDVEAEIAINRLRFLGLSENQILNGLVAGCRVIAKEDLKALECINQMVTEFQKRPLQ
jgi:hypothetical protein